MNAIRLFVISILIGTVRIASANITMTPDPLDAGNVLVGSMGTSSPGTLHDTLGETVDLVIAGGCTGTGAGTFMLSQTTNIDLSSDKMITVTYSPTTRGVQNCNVNVNLHTGGLNVGSFNIEGTGIAPVISVNTASINFGNIRWNDLAPTHTAAGLVTVTNNGDADLTVASMPISGTQATDFSITAGPAFPATIGPGKNASWTVTYNPAAGGASSGTLTINNDDPVNPTKTVALSGNGTNAVIAVTDIAFGIVNQGSAGSSRNISVSNTGTAPLGGLGVTQATFANNAAGWFTFNAGACTGSTTTCALAMTITNVPANVAIKCAPPANASGTQTATVTFTSDTDDPTFNTSMVSCTAGRGDVVADMAALAFGTVLVNSNSASQTVTLTNSGNVDLSILAVTRTGSTDFNFTSNPCATGCTIHPSGVGSSQAISIRCSPTATGMKSGNIHITSNDPDTSPLDIPLSCTGIAPHAVASPNPVAYGNVEVGTTSMTKTITVMNTGTATLDIASAAFSVGGGDYLLASGTAGMQTVAAGASTSWDVQCKPSAQGARNGTFHIVSDTDAVPNTATDVSLTCTGTAGNLIFLAPTSFNFGGVRIGDPAVTHDFTLQNTGNLPVTGITVMLTNTAGYSITSAPTMLAAGATGTVRVQFLPTQPTDGGASSVIATGSWGTQGSTASATANVNGQALVAGYDTNPHSFDFGDQRFDKQITTTITIVDTGSSAVGIQTVTIVPGASTMTGEFTVLSITHNASTIGLPFSLSGLNDSLVATVRFAPMGLGARAATLHIHSDLGNNPDRDVALTGNSVTAGLSLTPPTGVLDFGAVDIDGPPVTQSITLVNTGQATLNTTAATFSNPSGRYTLSPVIVGAQAILPGGNFSVNVTYAPTVAMPANQHDTATLTFPLVGISGGPNMQTITIEGRGITRHISIGSVGPFPDTFINPGDKAPVMPVHIQNSGEATLSVTGVMLAGAPVWSLVDPTPVDIPGLGSYDFMVRFTPVDSGKAPEGSLSFIDNDKQMPMPMAIKLNGNGIDRAVDITPPMVDLGFTGIGAPVTLSERAPDDLPRIINMDSANDFTISDFTIDGGEGAFQVVDASGGPFTGATIARSASLPIDVVFDPPHEGDFQAVATLKLDPNPKAQRTLMITGHAVFIDAKGGAGCSAGRGSGGGMLLVIGALWLARRKRRRLALATLVIASTASADTRDLDLAIFHPTPSTTGKDFQLQAADVGSDGQWVATALISYANDPLVLSYAQGNDAAVKNRTMFEIGGAYAFLGRFEAGARLPLYLQSGDAVDTHAMPGAAPASGGARGDLMLHGKAKLFDAGNLSLGLGGSLELPTATAGQFAGVSSPQARVLGLVTFSPDPRLSLHVNAGGVIRSKVEFQNVDQGSGVVFGVGASYRVLDELWATGELFGEIVPSSKSNSMGSVGMMASGEALAGVKYQLERRATVGLAVGRAVLDGVGAPALRGVLLVTVTPGAQDVVPIGGPHVDGDRDGDGILDSVDKCPNEPEDKDMFEDDDGCPDPDNDHDGISDAQDMCPLDAEDKDGFQDEDGCPDKDNDNDGIPDAQDKCPNQPEDKDGFQDLDGCPDPDNDNDGVPDEKDRCPNEPETINGIQDDDGCPDRGDSLVVLSPDRLDLLEVISFNGTKLTKQSFNLLGQIGATLRAHGEIARIRVTSHVQPSNNAEKDQDISEKRAQAVRDWLVQWGIAASRIEAKGFGGTKPLVPADQKGSALINERLELIILERK